jgi:hypothetical protein
VAHTAFNIGRGNYVDLYSPYVENVPNTDVAYGLFRIGQDYPTAVAETQVNFFGGDIYGTNGVHVNSLAFDLGRHFDRLNVFGTRIGRIGTFQSNTADCSTCTMTLNAVRADITGTFGMVSHPINFNVAAGNRFNTGLTASLSYPPTSTQQGTLTNAPPDYNSPGQLYYATDQGLMVWDNSLATPTWVSTAAHSIAGGFTVNESAGADGFRITGTPSHATVFLHCYVSDSGNSVYCSTENAPFYLTSGVALNLGSIGTMPLGINYDPFNGIAFGDKAGVMFGDGAGHRVLSIDQHGMIHNLPGSGTSPTLTVPTSSAGTLQGTNAVGSVSGLSGASSVTITFANGGWTSWASCPSLTTSTGVAAYPSAQSKTAVTVTFASVLTGTLYYGCGGN